jgi:hypothetical protein
MVGRVIAGTLGAVVVAGAALVLGFRAYQAYLEWLVAGTRKPVADEA